MNNKVMYMTFYENWVEVMEMCTPEEWYELCKIITNLRFKGIDTDAKTISNIKIKMAWNLIRPSILKSNRDKRYNDTKRNTEETKKSTITEVKTTEFEIPNCQISNTADLSPSNNEEVEQPQPTRDNATESLKMGNNEIIEENTHMEQNIEDDTELKFYEYCEEVGNLLDNDDDIKVINNILARGLDYLKFGKMEYEEYATTGNDKIMEIANKYFNYKENEKARVDFLYYISEYNEDYIESVSKKINEYDRFEYDAA